MEMLIPAGNKMPGRSAVDNEPQERLDKGIRGIA